MLKLNWAAYFHLLFEQVLEANPVHVKALYRRGTSYMLLGEFNDARNDFEKVSDTILQCHV
jgi:Flp pilus assembly protein TadD